MLLPVIIFAGAFDCKSSYGIKSSLHSFRPYRLAQQMQSYWDGDSWIAEMRVIPYYNPTYPANVDSMHGDYYDTENGVWIPAATVAYLEYNAAGYVTSNTIYIQADGYIPMIMANSVFDDQNRLTHLYAYSPYQNGQPGWEPVSRLHIEYGEGTSFMVINWNSGGDEPNRNDEVTQTHFTFDNFGRIVQEFSEASPDSSSWMNDSKTDYFYHAQDSSTGADLIQYIAKNVPLMYINDSFELPGMYSGQTGYYWDGIQWVYDYRYTYQYNEQLQKTSRLTEGYNTGGWEDAEMQLFYYDANGNPDHIVNQYHDWDVFVNAERIDYSWDTYTSNQDYIQNVSEALRVKAYPSPFSSAVNLVPDSKSNLPIDLSIYNLKGQLVYRMSGFSGEKLVWNGTDTKGKDVGVGIYFVRSKQGGDISNTKIIKIK